MDIQDLVSGLVSVAKKAVTKSVKGALEKNTEAMASSTTITAIRIAATLSGNFVSEITLACLKAILAERDRLSEIERSVSKLVREPLKTGVERLRIADSLPAKTPNEVQHRLTRLRGALESFDRAVSVAESVDRPPIDFLRGLVAAQIPGAEDEAALHFTAFSDYCAKRAVAIRAKASALEVKASEAEEEANGIDARYSLGVGGGFAGMEKALPWIRKSGLIQEAKRFRAESIKLLSASDDLNDMAEVCREAADLLRYRQPRKVGDLPADNYPRQ
jgi:hypothetical protein